MSPADNEVLRRWQLVVFVVLSMERRTIHSGLSVGREESR